MMHWLGGEDVESLCTHETSPFKHYDFVEHTKARTHVSMCTYTIVFPNMAGFLHACAKTILR